MRVDRFIRLTTELLRRLEHPDIAKVEPYAVEGTWLDPCGVKVTMRDNSVVWLRATATTRDGGDNHKAPEEIPFPDWEIPSDLKERLWAAGVRTAT